MLHPKSFIVFILSTSSSLLLVWKISASVLFICLSVTGVQCVNQIFYFQVQSQELHVPPSPSECDGQDSGGDFDFKLDGDDDGFIDDFVQEQSKEVHNNENNLAADIL